MADTRTENSIPNGTVQTQDENQTIQDSQPNQEQQRPAQSRWSMLKGFAIRMFIIYLISSFFRRGSPPVQKTEDGTTVHPAKNILHKDMMMDMYIYVSGTEKFTDFDNPESLFWLKKGLQYGDWTSGPTGDGSYVEHGQIAASESVQNNGSLYIHVFIVKEGASPDPNQESRYFKNLMIHKFKRLNKYKKRKFHSSTNLITGQTDVHPDLLKKNKTVTYEILSHWHPNLTINLLDDHTPWMKGQIPNPLDEYIVFTPDGTQYYPVVYFNDYWNLNSDFQPVNETTKVLNLTITFSPISLFRWQMYAAQGMRNKWMSMLGDMSDESEDSDQDSLKTTILETNPYLLGMTIVVSLVHSVFEFLAFKNDIQFWRSRKSLEGLSVRSVFFNVFQSIVIVLYVLDNETNFVVKISVFIGLLIEVWKIFKVIDVQVDHERKLFGVIPFVVIKDKSTYTQTETKRYDTLAFKYLSWLLFPLLGAYAVYSLFYLEHKGWYSWVLNMLYGFLLMFGFIMMTPQLFINYKLKSVAHLPWRMLSYKFLNTFIDDIFAFVIKMPTLYRIGCFRDDIVFLIYLYQRWVYRVDPKRMNEFGVSQEMLETLNTGSAGDNKDAPTAAIESSDASKPATEGETTDSQDPELLDEVSEDDVVSEDDAGSAGGSQNETSDVETTRKEKGEKKND